MEDVKFTNLIGKYLSGNMSSPEKEELMSWVEADSSNQAYLDEMIELWGKTADVEAASYETDVDAAWAKVDQRLSFVDSRRPGRAGLRSIRGGARRWLRVAAAALVLVVAAWWILQPQSETWLAVNTRAGEVKPVSLPDGSQIWLNANSTLSYPEKFKKRKVKLSGEAYFEVVPMKKAPFEIFSGETRTIVLGTAFNVRAYPEEEVIEISVASGEVLFEEFQGDERVKLQKDHAAVFNRLSKKIEKAEEPIPNVTSWKTRIFDFEDLEVEKVLKIFERHFGVNIEVENKEIENLTFNLQEEPAQDLPNLLAILAYALQLEVDTSQIHTDNLIILK